MKFQKIFTKLIAVFIFSICYGFAMPSSTQDFDRGGRRLPALRLFCGEGYIDNAGFALIKDYGSSENPAECTLVVGEYAEPRHYTQNHPSGKTLPVVNFFAGPCQSNDKDTIETAVNELYEKTGKTIHLTSFDKEQYITDAYGFNKFRPSYGYGSRSTLQLFLHKTKYSTNLLTHYMSAAYDDAYASHRFKQMNKAHEIPLVDILMKFKRIQDLEHSIDLGAEVFDFKTLDTGSGSTTVLFHRPYLISAAIGYKKFLHKLEFLRQFNDIQERHKQSMKDILTSKTPTTRSTLPTASLKKVSSKPAKAPVKKSAPQKATKKPTKQVKAVAKKPAPKKVTKNTTKQIKAVAKKPAPKKATKKPIKQIKAVAKKPAPKKVTKKPIKQIKAVAKKPAPKKVTKKPTKQIKAAGKKTTLKRPLAPKKNGKKVVQ